MEPGHQDRPAYRITLRIGRSVLDHRALVLLVLLGVTVGLGWFARQFDYDFSILKFFPDDSEMHAPYLAAEAIFGRDDARNIIAFDLPDVYEPSGMAHVRELTEALERLDGVALVTSVANVQRLRGEEDGIIIEPLVADDADAEALVEAREVVRNDPLLNGLYVSTDEKAVAIVVELSIPRSEADRRQALALEVDRVLDELGRDGVTYHTAGIPHTRTLYGRLLLEDNRSVIPGVLALLIVTLVFIYRRPAGVILPVAAVGMALTWTLGITVLLDRPLNMITNTMTPVVLVVGIADSIHILNTYRERYREIGEKRAALEQTIGEMAVACMMTSFTTAIGFGVLVLTNVPILREFGFISATGVAASYLCTVLGLPVALSFLAPFEASTSRGLGGAGTHALAALHRWVVRHRRRILAGGMLISAAMGALATRVERDSRVLEDLRPSHPEIQSRNYIEERFGGAMPFNVVVRGEPDDFRKPESVAALARVAGAMAEEKVLGWPIGLHSLVETLHGALAPDHQEKLPASRPLLAQELLPYEMSGDERLEDLVAADFSSARIMARAHDAVTSQVDAVRSRIWAVARAAFPASMQVDVTSTMLLAQMVNRSLIGNMSTSFLTAFLVIFVTMFLMFRSWKLAALALVPNVAPLFCLVGFMAITGIGLKVSTAFIFAIAFGIAVDDTIHFLARVKRERALGATHEEAVRIALTGTGRPIVQTTMVLVLGFAFLLTSDFLASFNFGLLTGVTLSVAVIADVTLLPALLLTIRRW